MALDVEPPEPPDLSNRGVPGAFEAVEAVGGAADLHRQEVEAVLRDGAWREGFEEWAAYTDLTEPEYRAALELGLIDGIDFYWNPAEGRLAFELPPVPENWRERVSGELPAGPGTVEAAVRELGRTVLDLVNEAYLDPGESEGGDPVWTEELFGEG